MSQILVTIADFKGKYAIALNDSSTQILQDYIDRWERKTIMKLLGVDLGTKLIDYIQDGIGSGEDDRFEAIINPFDVQLTKEELAMNNCGCENKRVHSSLGLIDVLLGKIYFEFTSDDQLGTSQSGIVKHDVEVAKAVTPREAQRLAESKYNGSLETAMAIQWYCCWKKDESGAKLYPEYEGIKFSPEYGSLL